MYATASLGSFAINNDAGTCDLYITLNSYDGGEVTLGSMFLQNFRLLFTE
jgi:hypothetical protein